MAEIVPKPLRLSDIARILGVSKTTVSAALNDDRHIALKTRERVKRFARENGYAPNAHAAALGIGRSGKPVSAIQIAIISNHPLDENHRKKFQRPLNGLGYKVDYYQTQEDTAQPKLNSLLYHRGYRGIVFHDIRDLHPKIFEEDWSQFSVVLQGNSRYRPPFDMVRQNSLDAIALAWKKVRSRGYRRIGFTLCRHQPRVQEDFEREGALWALQTELTQQETAIPPYLGVLGDRVAFRKWFQWAKPDVLVAFNSLHFYYLRELGLRVPEDIPLVSLHADPTERKIAGINNGGELLFVLCAEHINQLIRHNHTGPSKHPRDIILSSNWLKGLSFPED